MYTQRELEERMAYIVERINGGIANNMNTLLAPEVCSLDAETLTSEIRFKAMDWEKNQRGEIHGGAVAAMFDTVIGMSIGAFSRDSKITTTDLNISYIRPFLGEAYLFHVEILRMGRTIARARSIARDEKTGKLLASATANFMYIG